MDAEPKPVQYLVLKEFLAQNPCVKLRTFTRWKQRGLIDFIQPGGPNTAIFVPADALTRMQQCGEKARDSIRSTNDQRCQTHKPNPVRQPDWMKQIKPRTKDNNAQEE